ncbi:MAG: hypothetical protein O3A46_00055 [Candidatus Poribacteria bacterium]|nr:hypothetical protein [Candidatus Poribacteria bacterium]
MTIRARIENVRYAPTMCAQLPTHGIDAFLSGEAFRRGTFHLNYRGRKLTVSHWVSPKRTRSYPYARVYDSMDSLFPVTIIPVWKDEGQDGDSDFLQWDTVSLMSLLNVYVVLGYYADAERNPRYEDKITSFRFDTAHLRGRLDELLAYKSSALHWNLHELEVHLPEVWEKAVTAYERISKQTGVQTHNPKGAHRRIELIRRSAEAFKDRSRIGAESAQQRESVTTQPKESVSGDKATITIENYLGGEYYFTADEFHLEGDDLYLIEKKHSSREPLPSLGDIKDGLVKMILFTNLVDVTADGKPCRPHAVLGLTSSAIRGAVSSASDEEEVAAFLRTNRLWKTADGNTPRAIR